MGKTLLLVNACVRPQSRTLALARDYIHSQKEDFEIKEVCLESLHQQPLTYEALMQRQSDIEKCDFSSEKYEQIKDFINADEIVIAAPYWDFSFPSSLKVYFEHLCVNGLTFKYDAQGQLCPLCHAKNLVYITTSGGYIGAYNSGEIYIRHMCDMFGIKTMQTYTAEGLDIYGNDIEKILDKTRKQFT